MQNYSWDISMLVFGTGWILYRINMFTFRGSLQNKFTQRITMHTKEVAACCGVPGQELRALRWSPTCEMRERAGDKTDCMG